MTEYFEACHLEPYVQSQRPRTARPVRFTVRKMNPDEAIEVSRTVYRAYGYSYAVSTRTIPKESLRSTPAGTCIPLWQSPKEEISPALRFVQMGYGRSDS